MKERDPSVKEGDKKDEENNWEYESGDDEDNNWEDESVDE